MKLMKKMMALVIAMVMVLAMALPALAATVNLTVPDNKHTYEIYQIFKGDVTTNTEGNKVLSNAVWGKNGTGTEGNAVPSTTMAEIAAKTGTDAEKAAALKAYANLSSTPYKTVSDGAAVEVDTGYYLIKDKDSVTLEKGDEHTLYIVNVFGDTTITRKAGTVEAHKTIDDVNDSDTTAEADNGTYQTSSDYDIGDDVPYHLIATMSNFVEEYKKYHITFVDTLEEGKFDEIGELTIKLNGEDIADTDDYTVTTTNVEPPSKAGFTVKIEFTAKDGKTLASLNGAGVTIDFTAKLGENAAIGEPGNKNTFHLEYSNNPNDDQGEGKTPDENVITFTYKVDVDKFDQDGTTPLEGAGFTLYKVSKADAEAGVTGADAGAKNTAWAGKAIKTWTTTASEGKTTGKNNRFSFKGIDDGYYVLCETTTPGGYNTLDPQVFKVTATHGGNNNKGITLDTLSGDKVTGDITFTADKATGSLSTNVTNAKGTILPSTGGIGTTIFYIIGSILVIGAGVLLVVKKRMSAE